MADSRFTSILKSIGDALNSSVRPVLAYGFGGAVIALTFMGMLTPEAFLGIAAMVIGFFFRERTEAKVQEQIESRTDQLVELAKQIPSGGDVPPVRRDLP